MYFGEQENIQYRPKWLVTYWLEHSNLARSMLSAMQIIVSARRLFRLLFASTPIRKSLRLGLYGTATFSLC